MLPTVFSWPTLFATKNILGLHFLSNISSGLSSFRSKISQKPYWFLCQNCFCCLFNFYENLLMFLNYFATFFLNHVLPNFFCHYFSYRIIFIWSTNFLLVYLMNHLMSNAWLEKNKQKIRNSPFWTYIEEKPYQLQYCFFLMIFGEIQTLLYSIKYE